MISKRHTHRVRGALLAAAGALFLPLASSQTPAPATGVPAAPRVAWEVKNRFPLFKSGTALSDVLRLAPGQTLLDWSQTVLAAKPDLLAGLAHAYKYTANGRGCKGGSTSANFKTQWNPCTETYAPELFSTQAHDIVVRVESPPAGRCLFILGEAARLVPCNEPVELQVSATGGPRQLTVQALAGGFSAVEDIQVRDLMLVAFGDSFSSGESNPDLAAIHDNGPVLGKGDIRQPLEGLRWTDSPHRLTRQPVWLDGNCHRSILSWPILAAAKLAVENPHMVVRIASWACSGAEIPDGFFTSQLRDFELRRSQFDAARDALCKKNARRAPPFPSIERLGKGNQAGLGRMASDSGCVEEDRVRPIDAVLLTFGGNDVFFAPVIADTVAITGTHLPFVDSVVKPLRKHVVKTPEQARDRILGQVNRPEDRLQQRYAALDRGIRALGVTPERVFQVQYPNPLYEAPGRYCDISAFDGMDIVDLRQRKTNITKDEARHVESTMIMPLQQAISGRPYGWNVVDRHVETGKSHGLCAYFSDKQKELAIPRLTGGNWVRGELPSQYRHYAATARWFRTPDDVVMGVYQGSSLLPISGAFHPSAQAHGAIADAVFDQLKLRFATPARDQ